MIIEPGAVATELTDHITHPDAKQAAEQLYEEVAITAQDIAEVIAFAIGRPRRGRSTRSSSGSRPRRSDPGLALAPRRARRRW
jgi:hypothetical protein